MLIKMRVINMNYVLINAWLILLQPTDKTVDALMKLI